MGVENVLLLLDASNNVDVSVRNYDGLGVVGKVAHGFELLDLVSLICQVKEVAVVLFDGEDGYLLHLVQQVGGLADCYASFICLDSSGVVDCRNGIAKHF